MEQKDDADEALAPSSKHGDEGILEGVAISEEYEKEIDDSLSSNSEDDEDEGVVIHAGRLGQGVARGRTPMKSLARSGNRVPSSSVKDAATPAAKKDVVDLANYEELKKLRFGRHVTAFDVDMTAMEDQPWRNKNVDLSDYFNYGFNERTWMVYCEKQLKIRAEKGLGPQVLRDAAAAKVVDKQPLPATPQPQPLAVAPQPVQMQRQLPPPSAPVPVAAAAAPMRPIPEMRRPPPPPAPMRAPLPPPMMNMQYAPQHQHQHPQQMMPNYAPQPPHQSYPRPPPPMPMSMPEDKSRGDWDDRKRTRDAREDVEDLRKRSRSSRSRDRDNRDRRGGGSGGYR